MIMLITRPPCPAAPEKEAPPMNRPPRPTAASGWPRALFYLVQFTWGLPVNLAGLLQIGRAHV